MVPLAGYARVSHVGDRPELRSPEMQAERIAWYAKAHGLMVEMFEPELDESGGKLDRPILEAAIVGIEQGRYSGIIVSQLDRLSRLSLRDALTTIERIEAVGGKVVAVAENFDADTEAGEMARNVMLSVSHMQLRRYSNQFANAKENAIREGIWSLPSVPLGYQKDKLTRKLIPGPEREVARLEAGFKARASGQSWRVVADTLGVSGSTARDTIRNRVYLGELHYGKWANPKAHEPLIARSLWEAAQLDHPRPARGSREPTLLPGLVRCAGCSRTMVVEGGRPRSYMCGASKRRTAGAEHCSTPAAIKADTLDAYVEGVVLDHLDDLWAEASERTARVSAAEDALSDAERELDAYQTATKAADLGADLMAAGLRHRADAVQDARHALGVARMAAGPLPEPQSLRALWPELSVEERRHVLRGALSVVWVRKGRGHVADRVRLIAAGHAPHDLSSRGRPAPLRPVDWTDDDLPGEVRATTS
jgi:DNA invertase Pin-like site-specific DNA recombinase